MFLYKIKRITACIAGCGFCREGRGYGSRCRDIPCMRMFCYALLVLAAVEFIIINFLLMYVYSVVSSELSEIQPKSENDGFLERLHRNKKIRNLVSNAREGGFLSLLQDTIERLYIVKEPNGKNLFETNEMSMPKKNLFKLDEMSVPEKIFYSFGMDVSHSGEASFIYKRILSRNEFPYHNMIVDIGANDGFISSNSFNFIQFGWNAVLVEPQFDQINLAKKNLKRYIAINREPRHEVHFVQAAVGRQDGSVNLFRKDERQESFVVSLDDPLIENDRVIQVPSITVKTLADRYSIPKNFGILSIDAEGKGYEILLQWFALKFTPAYIIFETLHIQQPLQVVTAKLERNDYVYIGTRGWNSVYEHRPKKS